jgi:ribosomal protein S18 acetylase RimI-like enzyme
MAALPDRYADTMNQHVLVDLRDLSDGHLEPLLEEETENWRTSLDWDFRASAELVRRFVHLRALNGFALVGGGRVNGYSYYLSEEGKGLIGDFYVRSAVREPALENRLLDAVLEAMWRTPGMRRVEAQLMMFGPPADRTMPYMRWFRSYPRRFFEIPLSAVRQLQAREPAGVAFAPWGEDRQGDAARLISVTYRGHVDSQINDQYRSPAGARRFLTNIVQYPGCGSFFGAASFAAWDRADHSMCGVSLASLVAHQTGHITQICVSPNHQGQAIGFELLRRSLIALAAHGCQTASLTATIANESAVRLYERMGFRGRRDFAAFVWEPK